MKKLVIILLVLIVVTLGGAGGLVMLGIVRNPFKPAPVDTAKPAGPELSPSGLKVPTEALVWVKVPDMIVPVIVDGAVKRRVSVSLRLVTKPNPVKERVSDDLPKYQDALLEDLILYFQDYFPQHQDLDVETIRKKANADATKVYGEDVSEVLLTNVFDLGGAASHGNFAPDN